MENNISKKEILITSDPRDVTESFVYIKRDMDFFPVFSLDNFFGAICDLADKTYQKSAIPKELVTLVDLSINGPIVECAEVDEIAYCFPCDYGSIEDVFVIVSLFNRLPSTSITIYLPVEIYQQVSGFANDHIRFNLYKNSNEITIKASKVITYGYFARNFIHQEIPVLIIGSYGMGGWVTPDNIEYLFKTCFKGRPGGTLNEPIPLEILVDELLEIKECNHMRELLVKNKAIIKNKCASFPVVSLNNGINGFKRIYEQYNDKQKKNFLRPKLTSNVRTIMNGNNIIVERNIVNDILFSVGKDEKDFLSNLNGEMDCEMLQKIYEIENKDFWNIMNILWKRKAIVFSDEVP